MDLADKATATRALPVILDLANDKLQKVISKYLLYLTSIRVEWCLYFGLVGVWAGAEENQKRSNRILCPH